MAIEKSEFRHVMSHLASAVTVVTTHDGAGRQYGLTASAVCSLSLEPTLVLVCVDRRADSYPAFERSRVFVVNLLDAAQEELSGRFAVSGGDKFAGVSYRSGILGAAILEGTLGHLECRVVAAHEGGDHTIYVGEVETADARDGSPLLYFRGRYRRLRQD